MTTVRHPAVAGQFYPADTVQLHDQVSSLLAAVDAEPPAPKAIIAPHAGYIYSGPIAASAYKTLEPARGRISRVVLLGPDHRVGFRGLALSSADSWDTPLGAIPLDPNTEALLKDLPQIRIFDEAHRQEHSLEVQLPFLQLVLGPFSLIPIVVGEATTSEVEQVLERLWGGDETLIVISSDLSHYHDYATAKRLDADASHSIEALRPEDLEAGQACGRNPIRGLLAIARRRGLHARTVDLRNSGDTAGPRDQVVGYGAYVFVSRTDTDTNSGLDAAQRTTLLDLARRSIAHGLEAGRAMEVKPNDYPDALRQPRATFVTLHLNGQLRGCIGTLEAHRSLIEDVAENAFSAAFRDPRFPPVSADEKDQLTLDISVLSPASALSFTSEQDLLQQLRPGVDGLILEDGARRGTFLPSVWEQLPRPAEFLRHLKQKAGLPADYWSSNIRVSRYTTESFG